MTDAEEYIGRTVLIGLTRREADGTLIAHEQMFGTIKAVTQGNVEITLDNGEPYYLPPDLNAFHFADKGEYRLKSTGKIVVDPDYICTCTVTKPVKN